MFSALLCHVRGLHRISFFCWTSSPKLNIPVLCKALSSRSVLASFCCIWIVFQALHDGHRHGSHLILNTHRLHSEHAQDASEQLRPHVHEALRKRNYTCTATEAGSSPWICTIPCQGSRGIQESVTRVLHTGRRVRVLKIAANHVQHHLARDTQRRAAKDLGIEWVTPPNCGSPIINSMCGKK